MITKALMKRPCTALVRQDRVFRLLRRHVVAVQVRGHHFKEELDWYCENCELRHVPSNDDEKTLRVEPCTNPTPSRFEEMLMDYLLNRQQPEEEN